MGSEAEAQNQGQCQCFPFMVSPEQKWGPSRAPLTWLGHSRTPLPSPPVQPAVCRIISPGMLLAPQQLAGRSGGGTRTVLPLRTPACRVGASGGSSTAGHPVPVGVPPCGSERSAQLTDQQKEGRDPRADGHLTPDVTPFPLHPILGWVLKPPKLLGRTLFAPAPPRGCQLAAPPSPVVWGAPPSASSSGSACWSWDRP